MSQRRCMASAGARERAASSGVGGGYQQAGVQMPAAVLSAAESAIQGEPLDAEKEATARDRRWNK